MPTRLWDRSFLESSQGRIIVLLRQGSRTIEELSTALGLTGNAVRSHITALERNGFVVPAERRRTTRKPAQVYAIRPEAEQRLSKAYAPVLAGLLQILARKMDPAELRGLMREVGEQLALGQPASIPRCMSEPGTSSSWVTVSRTMSSICASSKVTRERSAAEASGVPHVMTRREGSANSSTSPTSFLSRAPADSRCSHAEPTFQSEMLSCCQYLLVNSGRMSAFHTRSRVAAMYVT